MKAVSLRTFLGLSTSVCLLAANNTWAAQTLEYSIRWSMEDERYHVYMKPNATPSRDDSMTAQVTIRAPHASGTDMFQVSNLTSTVADTNWTQDSRADAPDEDTSVDYISFTLNLSKNNAFHWQENVEQEVFNFRNTGPCLGPVELVNNETDPFIPATGETNSWGTNPGNQFANLGWMDYPGENNYLGNYGPSADCSDSEDDDNDGIANGVEETIGSDPNNPDTDGDGIPDADELGAVPTEPLDTDGDGTPNISDADDDGDGTPTATEDPNTDGDNNPATNPVDVDGDGLADYLDPDITDGPLADPDDDGLTNEQEEAAGTNPDDPDSDDDGIPDGAEVGADPENPINTDGDSLIDALDPDDDNDGIPTATEDGDADSDANPETSPTDTDGDGVPDYLDEDDDGDGIPTAEEGSNADSDNNPATDPTDADGDGVPDYLDTNNDDGPLGDPDGDGLTNSEEEDIGTDPNDADSDDDGLNDFEEEETTWTDPLDPDTDGDGLNDGQEITDETDPLEPDTDDDGLKDGDEKTLGSDPLNPDTDGDGLKDGAEVTDVASPDDTDGDSLINVLDDDDDGDGIPSADEGNDPDGNGLPDDATDVDEDGKPDYLDTIDDSKTEAKLKVRVMLQGPYNLSTGLMTDSLRSRSFLPLTQPYSETGDFQYDGTEQADPALLAVTGDDAVVDWVLIEVRDAADNMSILSRKAALMQRDADVVDAETGSNILTMPNIDKGNYYVSIRHRNHLGVMAANTFELGPTPPMVDFSLPETAVFGTHARLENEDVALLWAGNANVNTNLIANGPSQDSTVVLTDVLLADNNGSFSTNFILPGYHVSDLSMDSMTIFSGPSNDINLLLGNVLLHPGNVSNSGNYIVQEQLPK